MLSRRVLHELHTAYEKWQSEHYDIKFSLDANSAHRYVVDRGSAVSCIGYTMLLLEPFLLSFKLSEHRSAIFCIENPTLSKYPSDEFASPPYSQPYAFCTLVCHSATSSVHHCFLLRYCLA